MAPATGKKILILLAKYTNPGDAVRAELGEIPRVEYLELARRIDAEIISFNDVASSKLRLVRIAAKRGPLWGLAALAMSRRHAFDEFYVTAEEVGINFAIMMRAVGDLGRITLVVHHGGVAWKRRRLKLLGHAVWRNVIVLSSRQREIMTRDIGYPAYKVHRFDLMAPDAGFYRRQQGATSAGEYVFSCGREGRDYATFARAVATSPYPFRVVGSGWTADAGLAASEAIEAASNLEVQSNLSYAELRLAYELSRFVVTPIADVDHAAGVTAICEAMGMGKAIIATDSPGIRDYVRHGISGLVVPVGDERALARAIAELWNDPERCATMGAHNRSWIENSINLDRYVERVAGLFGILPTSP